MNRSHVYKLNEHRLREKKGGAIAAMPHGFATGYKYGKKLRLLHADCRRLPRLETSDTDRSITTTQRRVLYAVSNDR